MKSPFLILLALIQSTLLSGQASQQRMIRFSHSPRYAKWEMDPASVSRFQQGLPYVNGKSYIVIQFDHIPLKSERLKLEEAGVRLISYIPDFAYTAEVRKDLSAGKLQQAGAKALVAITASQKIPPSFVPQQGQQLWIQFFETVDLAAAKQQMPADAITVSDELFELHKVFTAEIKPERLMELAASPLVEYISPVEKMVQELNNGSVGLSRANILQSSLPGSYNLTGKDVTVGVFEQMGPPFMHQDFASRWISGDAQTAQDNHSTHVNGTVAGSGLLNPLYTGYAPGINLITDAAVTGRLVSLNYHKDFGMVLTNNSYGSGSICDPTPYTANSRIMDKQAIDFPSLLHVFAAGNSGNTQCPRYPTGFNTVHSGLQHAKSILTVGAVFKNAQIAPGSSKGPTGGGMLKPEIVAVGMNVVSTLPNNSYGNYSGTSMSAPAVTGGLALLYERYRQLHQGQNPTGALMKSILCNTATDLGNHGPDFSYGFGVMNLLRAVKALDQQQYIDDSVFTGATKSHQLFVPGNTSQLKIMLYWPDPPATVLSVRPLVNDLELEVAGPDGVTVLPLVLDTTAANVALPAINGKDHINNVEQVVIDHPVKGNYTIRVSGEGVTQNDIQPYYITYDMPADEATLTFPSGGEAFNPGEKIVVQWDAWGNNTNGFTLSYSADNGVTWSDISTTIADTTRQLEWTIPDTISNQVLIRLTRDSDGIPHTSAPFTILGVPAPVLSAVQCPSYMKLQWRRIKGAVSYDILRPVNGKMEKVGNTVDTFYLIGSLQENVTAYASVQAQTASFKGRRSAAIGRMPNTGTCTDPLFNNDLSIVSLIAPVTGRLFTSTALAAANTITVRIKNLDNAAANQYTVQYRVNGGAYITETVSHTINAAASYNYSFSNKYDFSAAGTYTVEVVVKNNGDNQPLNDTFITTIRHLENKVLDLTTMLKEDFESTSDTIYTSAVTGMKDLERFDFYPGASTNSIRLRKSNFLDSTTRNLQMLKPSRPNQNINSELVSTWNLSSYDVSTDNFTLDFIYYPESISPTKDSLWIRGNDQSPWLGAFNMVNTSSLQEVKGIDLGKILLDGGQNFSSSFQLRWTKGSAGIVYSLDNIIFRNSSRDLALVSIDTPDKQHTGALEQLLPAITVRNNSGISVNDIRVSYQFNAEPIVTEVIAHMDPHSNLSYHFSKPISSISLGKHQLRVWVTIDNDTHPGNNEIISPVINTPYITQFPYLENFETGDGGFYTEGKNISFAHGQPAYGKIYGAASGSKAWKTNLSGSYNKNENNYLYSPVFDVTALNKPVLSFSLSVNTDLCTLSEYCDALTLQYTLNGITWPTLFKKVSSYKYETAQNTPDRYRWQVSTTDLPRNEKNLQLRFFFRSDDFNNYEGIGIDDFHIYDSLTSIYNGNNSIATDRQLTGTSQWIDYISNDSTIAAVSGGSPGQLVKIQTLTGPDGPGNFHGQYYLSRSFVVQSDREDSFYIRLYIPDKEVDSLLASNTCNTCLKPNNAYRLGISVYQTDSTAELNNLITDNKNGQWSFIPRGKLRTVPFERGYYLEFKTAGNGEYRFSNGGLDSNSYLPVKLLYFSGNRASGKSTLNWSVAKEINIDRYEIEVAAGNTAYQGGVFQKIGEVKSKGLSPNEVQYQYDHTIIKPDVYYYRIKAVDVQGNYSYSKSIAIVHESDFQWRIDPNPSPGHFNLEYQLPDGETADASVFNAAGQLAGKFRITGRGFIQRMQVDLAGMIPASGIYFIKVITMNSTRTLKLVKY